MLITVFTPTYNRRELLKRVYYSLKQQTCFNFKWLIIDDGSTDETAEWVKEIQEETEEFEIEYVFKANGGLQSAYLKAYEVIDTELCACFDSDDCLSLDAIKEIVDFWQGESDKLKYAGILALDCDVNGAVLGGYYPPDMKTDNLIDIELGLSRHKKSDRMLIIRTDLCKKVKPAVKYEGEKSLNATYLHLQISEKYDFLILNKPVYIADYQEDGISKNKMNHFLNSPNSFADYRCYLLGLRRAPAKYQIKTMINYCSSCILAKRSILDGVDKKWLAVICYIPGWLLTQYIRVKSK